MTTKTQEPVKPTLGLTADKLRPNHHHLAEIIKRTRAKQAEKSGKPA